jgi:hypothetical protein
MDSLTLTFFDAESDIFLSIFTLSDLIIFAILDLVKCLIFADKKISSLFPSSFFPLRISLSYS